MFALSFPYFFILYEIVFILFYYILAYICLLYSHSLNLQKETIALGFCEINYLYIFERKILKCRVSLERLFKSGVSLEDCKGCLEPKVQEDGLEP